MHARADRIPHVQFGRHVRFDADELEAWWRERLQGPVVNAVTSDGRKEHA